ncbi:MULTISPECIES: glycosyl hydrolase family 18 protein [Megasphaera]|uniref:Glycoside hydrolase, family 18 n=1 Tax=Megasphaera vaginalis (ex Srinivasan et al. 2021) TaxID=1111454 RepID=U7ULW7_9FIRM|nr:MULTISPECIES: glycosyl hydrolase family 18 protein [Megasphaera]ERT60417.1 glycoside hydrolase, family 18 [Megasphaera vaginalis (ex Srinivasan et al. 2021)]
MVNMIHIQRVAALLLISLSAFSYVAAAGNEPVLSSTAAKKTVLSAQREGTIKEAAAFAVPVLEAPPSDALANELKITEDDGRWLVSGRALEQYGLYQTTDKQGVYRMILPAETAPTDMTESDRNVDLMLPGKEIRNGYAVDIRHLLGPLGISYALEGNEKRLLAFPERGRVAPVLKRQQPPAFGKAGQSVLHTVLFWDPAMAENDTVQRLDVTQPVISPCAFRMTAAGISLRSNEMDRVDGKYSEKGYALWPLVDNGFDPDVTHNILADPRLQEKVIKELVGYAVLYGFHGYNLDFENIRYEDRDRLTAFVAKLAAACHGWGLNVSMDITPLSDSKEWSLVYDRQALAPYLDYVVLMAYDQVGRTSSTAGPVASYPWVVHSVETLKALVPAEKIILGIPLYMRIWYETDANENLPDALDKWPKTVAEAKRDRPGNAMIAPNVGTRKERKLFVRTLTLADSKKLAEKYAAYLTWDERLQLNYLELPLVTGTVKIWFEDDKTLAAKRNLAVREGLGGVAFWRKGFEDNGFWQGFAKHELT